MKATIICNVKTKNRMMSDLYFRNHLSNYVHVNIEHGYSDYDLRVLMYIPFEAMPRELVEWIDQQPNAIRVLTRS